MSLVGVIRYTCTCTCDYHVTLVYSVKAMLLLIDCKDRILKESRILLIKNGRQEHDELPPAKAGLTHIDYGELGRSHLVLKLLI